MTAKDAWTVVWSLKSHLFPALQLPARDLLGFGHRQPLSPELQVLEREDLPHGLEGLLHLGEVVPQQAAK